LLKSSIMKMSNSRKKSSGRAISKVKRGNQKRNKLIKKGKLRPNSSSPYVRSMEAKGKEAKRVRHERRKKVDEQNGNQHEEEEEEEDPTELMDVEDALMLSKMSQNGEEEAGVEDAALERQRKRVRMELESDTEERALLPTKTKEGKIVNQTVKVKKANEEENSDVENQIEPVKEEEVVSTNEPRSVVSILAEREEVLADFKVRIGSSAAAFLERPEERLGHLEKLVAALDDVPPLIAAAGFKLAASTVAEVLKDVIPAYRIAQHDDDEGVKLKKETLRLHGYEAGVLRHAKEFLVKMEVHVRQKGTSKSPKRLHALKCLCDVLAAHPQFNYSPNILKLVVPCLNDVDQRVRLVVGEGIRRVLREDKRGEISLAAVRYVRAFVKQKKYNVRPDVVDVFAAIRLNYVEKALEDQREEAERAKTGKKNQHVSKKEKKRKKQLAKVEREMLEAKGEEAKSVRNKNFTEVAKAVFEVLFRAIKSREESPALLPPALRCLSVFAHTINVEFFDDLLRVLSGIVLDENRFGVRMLAVKTAFDVLSGPGESLTYDPGHFSRTLLAALPQLSASAVADEKELTVMACGVCRKVLVARKRQVSPDTVRAFCKALATAALAARDDEAALALLSELSAARNAHLRTFELMLECDDEGEGDGRAGAGASLTGRDFAGHTLWELDLLKKHACKDVTQAAQRILQIKK